MSDQNVAEASGADGVEHAGVEHARADTDVWDAVVVGAGPAGSVLSLLLAQRGHRVLLVDRSSFPRDKVCGSCLSGQAVAALLRLGLGHVLGQGMVTETFCLAANGRQVKLRADGGMTLSRRQLDDQLVQAAVEAGVEFYPKVDATIGDVVENARLVSLKGTARQPLVRARVVIAAGGLTQNFASCAPTARQIVSDHSRVGIGAIISDSSGFDVGTIYMAVANRSYVGIVVQEQGALDIAAAVDVDELKAADATSDLVEKTLKQAGLPIPAELHDVPWKGTVPLTRQRACVATERLFVIGDATGYVEPFTGQGIAWAVTDAEAVAPIASASISGEVLQAERVWQSLHQKKVRQQRRTCRLIRRGLQHPRFLGVTIEVLKRWPQVATPILRSIHGGSQTGSGQTKLSGHAQSVHQVPSSNV